MPCHPTRSARCCPFSENCRRAADAGLAVLPADRNYYALSAPLAGVLSDRTGRKGILLAGLMLFGGSTALVGSGKSFAALLVYRILTGIGAGMIEPAAYAIAGDAYSYERRGRAMGIITSALIASSVIGVPLAGAISDLAFWRWTFWSIALLTVPVLAAALPAIPRSRPDREALKETGLVRQLRAAVSSRPTCVS